MGDLNSHNNRIKGSNRFFLACMGLLVALLIACAIKTVNDSKAKLTPDTLEIPIDMGDVLIDKATLVFQAMCLSHEIDMNNAIHDEFIFEYASNKASNRIQFKLSSTSIDIFQSTMTCTGDDITIFGLDNTYVYNCLEHDKDPVKLYLFDDRIVLEYLKGTNQSNFYTFFTPDP